MRLSRGGDAVEVVPMEVASTPGGAVGQFDDGNDLAIGGDVVALFGAVVWFDIFFKQQVAVVTWVEVIGSAFTSPLLPGLR